MKAFTRLLMVLNIMNDGGRSLGDLRARLIELQDGYTGIQAGADEEERPLTPEEEQAITNMLAEFDRVEAEIARRERMMNNGNRLAQPARDPVREPPVTNTPAGQRSPVIVDNDGAPLRTNRANPRVEVTNNWAPRAGQWGWNNIGEFALAVRVAGRPNGTRDSRLEIHNAPTQYGQEMTGPDGGFAVPPDFRTNIMELVTGQEALLGRCDNIPTASNALVLPVDETTPWQTSGGIQAYWEGEAQQFQQVKPLIRTAQIRLNKLTALVGVTDELLEDAPAMNSYLTKKAPEKMSFKISRSIVGGTGAGQPLGLLNSPALVSVAKESGQAAATIVVANIVKMYARMYAPSLRSAVWLVNQDIYPQLLQLAITGAGGGVFPVFLPPGGLSDAPYGTLMGRPIIPTEACETLGTQGDIFFVDLKQYLTSTKVGGPRMDVSMHLWFDYDMAAYRFVIRVAGQPWWSTPATPRSGSANTLSPFVTLDPR